MKTSAKSSGGIGGTPLEVAETTFALLCCEPGGLGLDCTGMGADLPDGPVRLAELRGLLCGRTVGGSTCDRVWRQLVSRARAEGPAWTVACVGMALPALRSASRKVRHGFAAGDPHDLEAELLAGFLQALQSMDLKATNVRPRLCQAALRQAERARRQAETAACRRLPVQEPAAPPLPWGHPDFVLGDAVAKGVLTDLDSEVIGRTRLENRTLADAAAELGLTTEAAKKRRQRAEPVLCAAIRSGKVGSTLSLTITSLAPYQVGAQTSVRGWALSDTRPVIEPKGGWAPSPGPARSYFPATSARACLYPAGPPRPPSRHRRTVLRSVVLFTALATGIVLLATAADADTLPLAADALAAPKKKEPQSLNEVIRNLRNWLVGFLAALATLMATIGGLRYLLAGGDPGEVAKAKSTLRFAAFGYAIAALAPLLVRALKSIVGV